MRKKRENQEIMQKKTNFNFFLIPKNPVFLHYELPIYQISGISGQKWRF